MKTQKEITGLKKKLKTSENKIVSLTQLLKNSKNHTEELEKELKELKGKENDENCKVKTENEVRTLETRIESMKQKH